MVPAAPVNSPTWRKRTEGERERERMSKRDREREKGELRHEKEAGGRGKFAGVTGRSGRREVSGFLAERGGRLETRQKR